MHSEILPQNRADSVERRRHVRHRLKPFSTVVVQLGPSNGGSLLDVGGGGLSLQAVAKLRPEVELNLRFRLEGMTEAIDAFGRVTWLGPTQKVAGISFKNLPASTEQQIVQWIDAQQRSTRSDTSTKSDDSPLSPLPISPHRIRRPIADPLTPPQLPLPGSQNEISPQQKIDLPLNKSLGSLIQNSKPVLETLTFSKSAAAHSSRRSLSLDPSLIFPADNDSANDRLRESFASDSRRSQRRKIAIALAVVVIGILALFKVMPQSDDWINRAKSFIGIDVPVKLDPARAAVQVWAHDGYYYCADNPNFKTLQPGAVMTQEEALQNKYKPTFGYCQ